MGSSVNLLRKEKVSLEEIYKQNKAILNEIRDLKKDIRRMGAEGGRNANV